MLTDPVAVLKALSACPTAPFHEAYVARQIVSFVRDLGLTVEPDRYGNLLAWHRGGPDSAPPVALNAHMDHPALEITTQTPLTGRLLGGLRRHPEYFQQPVPVRVIDGDRRLRGRILRMLDAGAEGTVLLEAGGAVRVGAFATYDVGDFRDEEGLLYQPAADDLAGCAAIISTLARCVQERVPANVVGVFTRAEEVGLIGAMLVAQQRLLPPGAVVVSLEASMELPGALIGGGPVIRVGDRVMAFDARGEALLRRAAAVTQETLPTARIQRQLMDGGTCEATAYALAGYCTTGVAFPLGNYHNGGPDFQVAAEYIHEQDLRTGVALLTTAVSLALEATGQEPVAARLEAAAREAAPRLQESAMSLLI